LEKACFPTGQAQEIEVRTDPAIPRAQVGLQPSSRGSGNFKQTVHAVDCRIMGILVVLDAQISILSHIESNVQAKNIAALSAFVREHQRDYVQIGEVSAVMVL
jgi:hypothetical protein